MPEDALIKLRRQAERAVADMADGDLKTKAFEVFLSHLLTDAGGTPPPTATLGKSVRATTSSKRGPIGGSTAERILSLKSEGYFRELRTIGQVREELANRGWHYPTTALSGPLQELVQRRELRRQKLSDGNKKAWRYSNS